MNIFIEKDIDILDFLTKDIKDKNFYCIYKINIINEFGSFDKNDSILEFIYYKGKYFVIDYNEIYIKKKLNINELYLLKEDYNYNEFNIEIEDLLENYKLDFHYYTNQEGAYIITVSDF